MRNAEIINVSDYRWKLSRLYSAIIKIRNAEIINVSHYANSQLFRWIKEMELAYCIYPYLPVFTQKLAYPKNKHRWVLQSFSLQISSISIYRLNWNFPDYIRKWHECYRKALKRVMVSYSILMIAEYNLESSNLICNQI